MSSKYERHLAGPSWTEVTLGALLSLALGVVLAAVCLIVKPVATVKEIPKEPAKDVIYYVEGSRDSAKSRQAMAKQKVLLQGGSVVFNEDELNSLAASSAAPAPKPAAGAKGAKAGDTPPPARTVSAGTPNFRIRGGVMQVGVPVQVSLFGYEQKFLVVARGSRFTRSGDGWVLDPTELLVGSCPLQRVPIVSGLLMRRIVGAAAVKDDAAAAWGKLSNVEVDGATLKLTM